MTAAMLNPRRGMPALGYWSHKVLRWFVPFLMLGALLSSAALTAEPIYAFFLAAQGWYGISPPSTTLRPAGIMYLER